MVHNGPPNRDMTRRSYFSDSCTPVAMGVQEDYVQAYTWINLSAAQGNEKAPNAKNILRKDMTPSQIERAQALSAEIFRRIQITENDD